MVDVASSINAHVAAVTSGQAPATYRDSFSAAAAADLIPQDLADRLTPSAGLRNVLTHEYIDIDLQLVAAAIPAALADYREYVAAVAGSLQAL